MHQHSVFRPRITEFANLAEIVPGRAIHRHQMLRGLRTGIDLPRDISHAGEISYPGSRSIRATATAAPRELRNAL